MPLSAHIRCSFRTMLGEFVARSMYTAPSAAPSSTPCSPLTTASTSSGPGSDPITTSLPRAASAGVSAHVAPASSKSVAASGLMSCTTVRCPAPTTFRAIGFPILPNPINPMFIPLSLVAASCLPTPISYRGRIAYYHGRHATMIVSFNKAG